MQLDVGHMFSDKLLPDKTPSPEMLVRNSWVVRGYDRVLHDVANLSYRDLYYAQDLFEIETYRRIRRETPIVDRFISANIRAADSAHVNPPPYIIRELTGDRFPMQNDGRRTWRVGVVGVTEPPNPGAAPINGLVVEDPLVASRRSILEARARCDLLVVLAYLSDDKAFKLLDLNPEIDVMVIPRNRWTRHYQNDHTRLVYADPQTKILGQLRISVDKQGRVVNIEDRPVLLDEKIPSDPSIEEFVKKAAADIERTVKGWLTPMANRPKTPVAAGLFVTAETCGACHRREHAVWTQSAHARSFDVLEKKRQQFEPQCIGCHVTGYQVGGFQHALWTPHLASVQCEACHGPGQEHIADPMKPYGKVLTPQACQSCHTPDESPAFDFAAAWDKIRH